MRGAPRRYRGWSVQDDALLRRLYPRTPTKRLAKLLGRTTGAVSVRAVALRLKKDPAYFGSESSKRSRSSRRPWTAADVALLRELWPTHVARDVAARLQRGVTAVYQQAWSIGLKKGPEAMRTHLRELARNPDHPFRQHQFPKGHVPINKGVKGWRAGGRSVETQFKKGQPNLRWKDDYPVGSLRMNADGYVDMKVKEGLRAWRSFHRILWEDVHGPVPPGHKLRFKDGDRLNLDVRNLELVTTAEMMRRNTFHNLPKPLKSAIHALGQLKRRINEADRRLAGSPVRDAGKAARP